MPRVFISAALARRFTGGHTELAVEATTVHRLIHELDRRFPGFGREIEDGMAVAIDGAIHQDAHLAPLAENSEIYLIPKIGGG